MPTNEKNLSNRIARRGVVAIRRWRFALAAAIGIAIIFVCVQVRDVQALKARLLMAVPDDIPRDAELMRFAMPRGGAAYERHCASCHGEHLQGDRRRGVANLADSDWLYGSGRIGEIERIVLYGIRSGHSKTQKLANMPAYATANPYSRYKIEPLTPREVDDVAGLLYSFQHPAAVDAATVERGSKIYHGKGLCFDCHADHARGDPAIGTPNLTDDIWLYGDGSLESIKAEIARGLAGVCPYWIDRLPPETIRAVAVYVHAMRGEGIHG
jgi:cytochrome c oxidase cbb3-type subunit III